MAPFELSAAAAGTSLIPADLSRILRSKGPLLLALGASTSSGMFGVPVRSYHLPPGSVPARRRSTLAGDEDEVLGENPSKPGQKDIAKKEPQLLLRQYGHSSTSKMGLASVCDCNEKKLDKIDWNQWVIGGARRWMIC